MRVPIPIVLLLVALVVSSVWWNGTRKTDFLTPPSAQKLAEIRNRIESAKPTNEAVAAFTPPPKEPEKPQIVVPPPPPEMDLGKLDEPPALDHYRSRAPQTAAGFIELATALEAKGQFQRTLLAWERVIDRAKPDEAQKLAALAAINRLRPTLADWNSDPSRAILITLHAGAGKKMAKTLEPILEQTAREIEKASSGILKLTTVVTAGKNNRTAPGPAPVALWLAGPLKNSRATEVHSFTVDSAGAVRAEILKTVFELVRNQLSRSQDFTPPTTVSAQQPPLEALTTQITRLGWSEFATALNLPPSPPR
jgi:hypothetical protein